jgi:hypothetical protein
LQEVVRGLGGVGAGAGAGVAAAGGVGLVGVEAAPPEPPPQADVASANMALTQALRQNFMPARIPIRPGIALSLFSRFSHFGQS